MHSDAKSVEEYLAALPAERLQAIQAVREVIHHNLPPGYEEAMQYGMITFRVPLERYPATYNGQPLGYVSLASQKNYMSLYLSGIYADENAREWFAARYRETGKRLDMGKSCVRFRSLEQLPLELVGEAVARFSVDEMIALYEASRQA